MKLNTLFLKQSLKKKGLMVKDLIPLMKQKGVKVSEGTLKSWTRRNNPRFPTMKKIFVISEILEVDYVELIIDFPIPHTNNSSLFNISNSMTMNRKNSGSINHADKSLQIKVNNEMLEFFKLFQEYGSPALLKKYIKELNAFKKLTDG